MSPLGYKTPCFAFQWIGQPFYSCDNCGNPFWEHTHEARLGKTFGRPFHKSISQETANRVRRKWEPVMYRDGYTPPMGKESVS